MCWSLRLSELHSLHHYIGVSLLGLLGLGTPRPWGAVLMWFAGWAMFSCYLGLESVLFCELEIFPLLIPQENLFFGFMISPLKSFSYYISGKCVIPSMYLCMEYATFRFSDSLQPHKCFLTRRWCVLSREAWHHLRAGMDSWLCVPTDKILQGKLHCVNRVVIVFSVSRNA